MTFTLVGSASQKCISMGRLPFCIRWKQAPSHSSGVRCLKSLRDSAFRLSCHTLPYLTGRGEQVHVAPDEEVVGEIRLERFGVYLSPVHVHCEEVNVVAHGVKRILVVRTVVRIIIDAAQHQTFWQGAEEQVLVRVRPSARGNGVHLAVDGPHRILDRALLESFDVRHLYGRIQGGLLCKQGGIDYVDPVIGVGPASHECKRGLTAHQSYLDIVAVDQEFILQKQVVEPITLH